MSYNQEIITYSQDKSVKNGVFLKELAPQTLEEDIVGLTHRDDYYVFILVLHGTFRINCELQSHELHARDLFLIKPYQIHTIEEYSGDFFAHFLSIQDFRIPDELTYLLFNLPNTQQRISLETQTCQTLLETIHLLTKYETQKEEYTTEITNGLFQAIIYKISSLYKETTRVPEVSAINQSNVITSKFKRLITTQTHLKQPSYFADLLFITPAHLNDCVKKTTGQTVSYWLKKSIIDEAKRLLYYTTKSVKEIAFELGYEDHTYFSRLFKKHVKQTPLQFRGDLIPLVN
ncbi:helix-turn-helix domain-containing protein [Myroides sp. 1354]|uniref:AraC family transcriptional regulator n=1 Tax=unclassified Myroides TaxID=2642485 RepID=UPI0025756665|nr:MULTISPECIES: helix-turn-helix transcriptional regulator [unclassified Myroides]MDM1045303.1 helix-turn-helix domain-containing protein [Myroides sp. R163-1]MDM1056185.1 helix-turn-helix domain-containing protein [Myroides sp. 1354]MDM1069314.1 helix-turn-helix domain-containing protein [Myroides sp. 1372]